MLIARRTVGTLVELRIEGSPSLEEIEAWAGETGRAMTSLTTHERRPAIVCTDFRLAKLFSQEVTRRMVTLMRADNPYIERSGILVSGSAVMSLQVQRMLSEAASTGKRQHFTAKELLYAWLDEVLLPEESLRLRAFISENDER